MLSLKQGLSIESSSLRSTWTPKDEATLEAWYQKAIGITITGSGVSLWADSSGKGVDMAQATDSERPAYANGVLTFDDNNTQSLQSSGQVSLEGDFTIGARLKVTTSGGVLLGDNTTSGEFIRFSTNTQFRVRIDNTTAVNIEKNEGNWLEDAYMVLVRSSDVLTLYWKGVAQTDTETLSGTADIDTIGVRRTDLNPYDGEIQEIQIFSSSSAALTDRVNAYLATL
tara:strand:- start:2247 stop:2924 length:678 start_codon:yes stop_codon:yes gene_type:complete